MDLACIGSSAPIVQNPAIQIADADSAIGTPHHDVIANRLFKLMAPILPGAGEGSANSSEAVRCSKYDIGLTILSLARCTSTPPREGRGRFSALLETAVDIWGVSRRAAGALDWINGRKTS